MNYYAVVVHIHIYESKNTHFKVQTQYTMSWSDSLQLILLLQQKCHIVKAIIRKGSPPKVFTDSKCDKGTKCNKELAMFCQLTSVSVGLNDTIKIIYKGHTNTKNTKRPNEKTNSKTTIFWVRKTYKVPNGIIINTYEGVQFSSLGNSCLFQDAKEQ